MNKKQYMDRIASLGCIVCGRPATLHHPRFAVGMAQRNSDWLVIPLCKTHHQDGGWGQAIHAGQTVFERNHGTEPELLAKTIQKLVSE